MSNDTRVRIEYNDSQWLHIFVAGVEGSYSKLVHHVSSEGVEDADHPPVGWDENLFAIIAELQASPVTGAIQLHFKWIKRALFQKVKITQLYIFDVCIMNYHME